jgi:DNA polymerase-3 subunit epsilon
MGHWSDTLVVFDTETTGLDTRHARIVTSYVGVIGPEGETLEAHSWLADPGVVIPDQAAAVHGITTEVAQRDGQPAGEVVREIHSVLRGYLAQGLPVVAYNASYDFSILHHESVRHGIEVLTDPRPIVDPLVIDRKVDTYRKGKRTLQIAAAHYLVRLDDSHRADADAIAAGRVAQAILRTHHAELAGDADWLHDQQVIWSREWAENYQAYRRSQGDASFVATGAWPVNT